MEELDAGVEKVVSRGDQLHGVLHSDVELLGREFVALFGVTCLFLGGSVLGLGGDRLQIGVFNFL